MVLDFFFSQFPNKLELLGSLASPTLCILRLLIQYQSKFFRGLSSCFFLFLSSSHFYFLFVFHSSFDCTALLDTVNPSDLSISLYTPGNHLHLWCYSPASDQGFHAWKGKFKKSNILQGWHGSQVCW